MQKLRSRELMQPTDVALDGDTAHVQLGKAEMEYGRSVGCERLALASLDALDLPGVLRDVGLSGRDARIEIALVIARMIHPSSEREALRWLETNSATLELLRFDTGQALKLDKLHRLSDLLVKHHRAIEDALFACQRKLLGNAGAVIFHDLTNPHMTGRPDSELARFGRSRQKRNDCPLVTLALATDEGEDKPTVIMDAGIATEDNLAALRERGFHWITVKRGGVKPDQVEAVNT